jgi:hypothetical protein
MGRLVKIKFPVTLWTVRPGSGPYVRCDTLDCMSGLETVRSLQGFQENLIFLHSSSYSPNQLLRLSKAS